MTPLERQLSPLPQTAKKPHTTNTTHLHSYMGHMDIVMSSGTHISKPVAVPGHTPEATGTVTKHGNVARFGSISSCTYPLAELLSHAAVISS